MKKFILLFLLSFSVFSQSLPPIQSYSPQEYNAANQNWMISESSDNEILFSNSEALLLFNGTSWNNYDSPNGSVIRSVKNIEDKIYIGTHSDFGFFQKSSNGKLIYTSLVDKLDLKIEEEGLNKLYFLLTESFCCFFVLADITDFKMHLIFFSPDSKSFFSLF